MHMRWSKLLFMHWPVPIESLRPLIPPGLEIDRFEGQAWLGIVPFLMSNVRPRFVPPMPGFSAFPELNVRTYVTHNAKPGVWFFSLDAASKLAVRGARRLWHLPYFDARMSMQIHEGQIAYRSTRTHKNSNPACLTMKYRPTGPVSFTTPGTLDHFLTNRLNLYSADRAGHIYRGQIHHAPWPLQAAEAQIETNHMTGQIDVRLPDIPPLLHYAERLDVVGWRIQRA